MFAVGSAAMLRLRGVVGLPRSDQPMPCVVHAVRVQSKRFLPIGHVSVDLDPGPPVAPVRESPSSTW